MFALALGALGVVYGDIGTSPLYALKECFSRRTASPPTHDNVLGVLSLIFWSLTLVVVVKYLIFVMRADNEGEGGILALLALDPEAQARARRARGACADPARPLRRGAALRRRHHHAGHLGARRGRGSRGRDADLFEPLRRADHGRRSSSACS